MQPCQECKAVWMLGLKVGDGRDVGCRTRLRQTRISFYPRHCRRKVTDVEPEDSPTRSSAFEMPAVVRVSGQTWSLETARLGVDRERVCKAFRRAFVREERSGGGPDAHEQYDTINTRNIARNLVNAPRAQGIRSGSRQAFHKWCSGWTRPYARKSVRMEFV